MIYSLNVGLFIFREDYNCLGFLIVRVVMFVSFFYFSKVKLYWKLGCKVEKVGLIKKYEKFYVFKDYYVFKLISILIIRKFFFFKGSFEGVLINFWFGDFIFIFKLVGFFLLIVFY